jgi:pyridoxal phosphate enzyme (YggS family)
MIQEKVKTVLQQIGPEVKLIAVSKTVPPERITEAYEAGVRSFGENRIQEAVPKVTALSHLNIEWHFIGHLQTNKAKEAVRHFSWIQSIDSLKLLHQVEKEAAKQQKQIRGLLELNLGNEGSKHGLDESEVGTILRATRELQWTKIYGFMIIPPFFEDPELVRPYFRKLREIRQKWHAEYPDLYELSMGMSHDFEIAVQEGATMVRVGSYIFGSREKA